MPVPLAQTLLVALGLYLLIGLVVALLFVTRWAGRIDHAASSGTWGFRVLALPGAAALWPLVLAWLRKPHPSVDEEADS